MTRVRRASPSVPTGRRERSENRHPAEPRAHPHRLWRRTDAARALPPRL